MAITESLFLFFYCNTLSYYIIYILYYNVILYQYMKKTEHFSFRTTEQNMNYLKLIAEVDDRTPAYVLSKMIDYFRMRGYRVDELNK